MTRRLDGVVRWGRALFTLERQPLALRLAVRGALGLIVPLLAGQALGWPALSVVALSAFLLAFGDLTEDRGWLARLATGSLFGALAVASGVLAGGHVATAALAMLGWGVLLGVAGVYGEGAAAMALPVAWVFFEIGLPAPERSIATGLDRGALIVMGGAWAVLLAWTMRLVRRNRPLVERTAQCYMVLADYLVPAPGDRAGSSRWRRSCSASRNGRSGCCACSTRASAEGSRSRGAICSGRRSSGAASPRRSRRR
jgi:uncharacterized membrane protein YccC